MTFIVRSYFDTLLRYAVTFCHSDILFCGAVVLKVMDQKTLVKRTRGYKVQIYKHLESLPDTSSQIFDLY